MQRSSSRSTGKRSARLAGGDSGAEPHLRVGEARLGADMPVVADEVAVTQLSGVRTDRSERVALLAGFTGEELIALARLEDVERQASCWQQRAKLELPG
eukprot:scaffold31559_cov32-Tisochrysis_lutea.AAC.2